jgi:hypothetical protein
MRPIIIFIYIDLRLLYNGHIKIKWYSSSIIHVLAMSFNHTFRYIDYFLSINNHNFHNYVHLIYPNELKIKDTTESDKAASYLVIVSNIDPNGRLTTSLYDKRDGFHFAVVNFPFLCRSICHFHLFIMCISPS